MSGRIELLNAADKRVNHTVVAVQFDLDSRVLQCLSVSFTLITKRVIFGGQDRRRRKSGCS